jgi:hypothetical protein
MNSLVYLVLLVCVLYSLLTLILTAMEFKEPHFCMTETDFVLKIKNASQNISANFLA